MSATDRRIGFELARALFVVAAFVVVVAGIRAAAVIMVPFLLALFIAVVTTPLYIGLQRRGLPSAVALLVIIIGLACFGVGGVALVGERGPELVDLPRGARVTPNHEMGWDTRDVVVNVHTNANPHQIGREVAWAIRTGGV